MRWIAIVVAVMALWACGDDLGENGEEEDGLDWSDPTSPPPEYESPYWWECFPEFDRPQTMIDAEELSFELMRDQVEPECVRSQDGFGGIAEGCSEAFGGAEGVYHLACEEKSTVGCVWHALGAPPAGVDDWSADQCEYVVVCVPEERWAPEKSHYSWDGRLRIYCPDE